MDFILIWRTRHRSGVTLRRVIGILEELDDQIDDFRNAGWRVVVLWKGVSRFIR